MRRPRWSLAAAATAAVVAAGCGTTLQGSASSHDSSELGLGGSSTGASGPGAAGGGNAPGTAGGSTGGVGGAQANAGGQLPGGGSRSSTSGVGPAGQGVGVTPTRVYVGVTYQTNGDTANNALGVGAITQGDQQADARAVIDDINAHGGVAGRTLTPVWYNYDTADTRPYAVQDQAACARFTQDNHVFAAVGSGITDDYVSCLTSKGVVITDALGSLIGPDNGYFHRYPSYFNVSTLSQDRMMADEANTLARMHYFSGWNTSTGRQGSAKATVGIITFETPTWERPLDNVMLPGLARLGFPVSSKNIQRVTYPKTSSDTAQSVKDIQSAVLRFRTNHVTHVIVLDANGSMTLQLLEAARGQHYYPRLGANSATGMQALADTGAVQTSQFNGAVGMGWLPNLDLSAGKADRYLKEGTQHCLQVVEHRTGQQFSSTNAASIALGYCDELYLLSDAINVAGSAITESTAIAAIQSLGSRFQVASLPAAYFSTSRHDAAQIGYDLSWNNACTCAAYGPAHRIP